MAAISLSVSRVSEVAPDFEVESGLGGVSCTGSLEAERAAHRPSLDGRNGSEAGRSRVHAIHCSDPSGRVREGDDGDGGDGDPSTVVA